MDYTAVCKAFYAATGIPVVLQRTRDPGSENPFERIGELVFSSVEFVTGIPGAKEWTTFQGNGQPAFCGASADFEYGMVFIDGTDLSIVIGPVFAVPVTEELVRKYMLETGTPPEYQDKMAEVLYSAPVISHSRYAWLLAFLHMLVNRRDYDIDTLYDTRHIQSELLRRTAEDRMEQLDAGSSHITYETEQQLYDVIRDGNLPRLDEFLQANGGAFKEGQLASSPLRHAKNIFIIAAGKLVSLSAIPGGMNAEQAYDLCDTYVQECEQQTTVEAVHLLQYSMLRDFTVRIGRARLPDGISPDIYAAVEYIRAHFNTPITTAEIASELHRSVSYLSHRFKEETGCAIAEYINQCRLEEAANLLLHSDKSLAEISSFVNFSSQPHFQNAFKKKYGVTPMQYRKRNDK